MKAAHGACGARWRGACPVASLASGATLYPFALFAALVGRSRALLVLRNAQKWNYRRFAAPDREYSQLAADALEFLAPFSYLLPLPFRQVAREVLPACAGAFELPVVSTPSAAGGGRKATARHCALCGGRAGRVSDKPRRADAVKVEAAGSPFAAGVRCNAFIMLRYIPRSGLI